MSDLSPTDPLVHTDPSAEIAPWRVGALIGGLLLALAALYIFYLHPWLEISSPIDGWIEQRACLIHALCTESSPLPHHLGLLAAIGALALFVAALWRPGDSVVEPEEATPWRLVWITLLVLLGLGCIGVQAYQALSASQTPSPTLWLIGIGTLALASLIWDAHEPAILARTMSGLFVAAGIAAILLGLGMALAQPATALWLLLPGGAVGYGRLGMGQAFGQPSGPDRPGDDACAGRGRAPVGRGPDRFVALCLRG